MVRINKDSIFRKVDLENVDSIRRIMAGLDYYLTNQVLSNGAPELRALRGPDRSEERFITNTILSTIRTQLGYPLLLEAVLRFIEARNGNDQQVLAAARDLETLAPSTVLTVPQAYPEAYAAAEARFNRTRAVDNFRAAHQNHLFLEQRAPGAFGQQIYSSHTGAELEEQKRSLALKSRRISAPALSSCLPDASNDSSDRGGVNDDRVVSTTVDMDMGKPQDDSSHLRTRTAHRYSGGQESLLQNASTKSQAKTKTYKKATKGPAERATTLNGKDSTNNDEVESDSSSSTSSGNWSDYSEFYGFDDEELSQEVGQEDERSWFRPLRTAGDIVVDDGTHDREPCRVGTPQPEKLVIEFQVVRKDPKNPSKVITLPNIQHKYRRKVDWNDKKSVGELSRWRGQIFFRSLGPKRGSRHVWLESERDIFLDLLEEHLKEIGGRWSRIDWDVVAKRYNKRLKGVIHKAGEVTAERRYDKNYQRNSPYPTSKSQPLKEDRKAPIRSGGSLQTQISYFTIPRAKKIKEKAMAEDQKAKAAERKAKEGLSGTDEEEQIDIDDSDDEGFIDD